MDFNNYSVTGGSLGLLTFIIGIIIKLNHTRIRSSCCGKKMEVSVDVEQTTPPTDNKNTDDKTELPKDSHEKLEIKISK